MGTPFQVGSARGAAPAAARPPWTGPTGQGTRRTSRCRAPPVVLRGAPATGQEVAALGVLGRRARQQDDRRTTPPASRPGLHRAPAGRGHDPSTISSSRARWWASTCASPGSRSRPWSAQRATSRSLLQPAREEVERGIHAVGSPRSRSWSASWSTSATSCRRRARQAPPGAPVGAGTPRAAALRQPGAPVHGWWSGPEALVGDHRLGAASRSWRCAEFWVTRTSSRGCGRTPPRSGNGAERRQVLQM